MIDFIILLQSHPYAVVGQKHGGWVGFMQDHVLSAIKCVWFNRGESEDKRATANRMVAHVRDPANSKFPLLIFPEGTCVNNEYVVQFKKFVFELGVPIHPIAIKYNKVFVDAYWNSREKSFHYHLFRLMSSWAVVVDIWFLDPQYMRPGEDGAAFATRIQRMIASRANLRPVTWDGYMKCALPRGAAERPAEEDEEALRPASACLHEQTDRAVSGAPLTPSLPHPHRRAPPVAPPTPASPLHSPFRRSAPQTGSPRRAS